MHFENKATIHQEKQENKESLFGGMEDCENFEEKKWLWFLHGMGLLMNLFYNNYL